MKILVVDEGNKDLRETYISALHLNEYDVTYIPNHEEGLGKTDGFDCVLMNWGQKDTDLSARLVEESLQNDTRVIIHTGLDDKDLYDLINKYEGQKGLVEIISKHNLESMFEIKRSLEKRRLP